MTYRPDRKLGSSFIYGGNLPTTPCCQHADDRGPALSNSLFEDYILRWNYNPATGKVKLDSAACATLGSVGLRHHA